jgi:hypothetical protein
VTEGAIIVAAIRVIVPLSILRWPLAGGIAAAALDTLDVVLIDTIGLGGFEGNYTQVDKLLDSYYLTLEAFVALSWTTAWARLPALALYVYRMTGVVLFETTDVRALLLVFPNLFENWWLYCLAVERFWPRLYPRSPRTTAVPLVLLLLPKLAQEYVLHYAEVQPWNWLKRNILLQD